MVSRRDSSGPLLTDSHRSTPDYSGASSPAPEAVERQRWWREVAPTPRDKLSVGMIATGLLLFLPITWIYVLSQPNVGQLGPFAPHPPLNALALTLFVLGIVPLQPPTPGSSTQRNERISNHKKTFLYAALPIMLTGCSFMYYNKSKGGAEHFTTWHGRFGALVLMWMLAQAAVGFASVWDGGKLLGGGMKAKAVYKYHRASGYALVTLALFTAHLGGAHSTWSVTRAPGYASLRLAAFWIGLPLVAAGVLLRVRWGKMKFF